MSSTILGSGKKLEDFMLKTEVFDTPGNFTFNHPNPGNALEVFVTLIGAGGGGGGGASDAIGVDASDGTAGGDSVWDVGGSTVTALGGGAGLGGQDTTNTGGRHATQSHYNFPSFVEGNTYGHIEAIPYSNSTPYGMAGRYGNGASYAGGQGGIGFVKSFSATITNNVNITIGQGGTGGAKQVGGATTNSDGGSGGNGAVIVQYAKAAAGFPTVSVTNKPEWEHFGELAWSPLATAADQSVTIDTLTTLNLDTEIFDTGDKAGAPSANQFTLEAGIYEFSMRVPVANVGGAGNMVLRVYNVSDSSVLSSGLIPYENPSNPIELEGRFSIPSQKTVRLEFAYSDGTKSVGTASGGIEFSSFTDAVPRTRFKFKWRPNS
jgi:hypothetical protein